MQIPHFARVHSEHQKPLGNTFQVIVFRLESSGKMTGYFSGIIT
jgi:hypothetical protein